jgi:hypothetical protein
MKFSPESGPAKSSPESNETILDRELQVIANNYRTELQNIIGEGNVEYTFDENQVITFHTNGFDTAKLLKDYPTELNPPLSIPNTDNPEEIITLTIYASGHNIIMMKQQSIDITI